jgi:hypothetical protein
VTWLGGWVVLLFDGQNVQAAPHDSDGVLGGREGTTPPARAAFVAPIYLHGYARASRLFDGKKFEAAPHDSEGSRCSAAKHMSDTRCLARPLPPRPKAPDALTDSQVHISPPPSPL